MLHQYHEKFAQLFWLGNSKMLRTITLTILLTVLLSGSLSAIASSQISHFRPGEYQLKKGSLSDCGEGEFKITEDGENIQMGAHHGVFTATKPNEIIRGDAEGDEECEYHYSSKVLSRADEDQVTLIDARTCSGKFSYKLTQVARFKEATASLDVVRTGSEKVNYSCSWEKVK